MTRLSIVLTSALLASAATAEAKHSKVYVANQGSNTVTVIDDQRVNAMVRSNGNAEHAAVKQQDFAVVATIPVGANPIAVGISADGAFAYVANLNSNSLSIIDTELDVVVQTVTV